MNDRELLENAAKAAGYTIVEYQGNGCALVYDNASEDQMDSKFEWMPKHSDGDAFRLAVKLDMNVFQAAKSAYALTYDDDDGTYEKQVRYTDTNNDPYAATRLAIVRAAAEIGKAMP